MAHSDPDRVLYGYISGEAWNLAWSCINKPEEHAAAVEELRQLAGDRVDLLAELAGTSIGVGESQLDQDVYRQVADLGLEAGADAEQIEYWIGVAGTGPSLRGSLPAPECCGASRQRLRPAPA